MNTTQSQETSMNQTTDRYTTLASDHNLTRQQAKEAYWMVSWHAVTRCLSNKLNITLEAAEVLRSAIIKLIVLEGGQPTSSGGRRFHHSKTVKIHFKDGRNEVFYNVTNFNIGNVFKPNRSLKFNEIVHLYNFEVNRLGEVATSTKYTKTHSYKLSSDVVAVEVSDFDGFKKELYKFHDDTSFADILAEHANL